MRDLLGNTLKPGSLLWWLPKGIPIRIARIEEPSSLVAINRQPPQKTLLILEVRIPLDAVTDGAETQLADFITIVNPDAERVLNGMLETQRTQ
jgi:hypothetical protein